MRPPSPPTGTATIPPTVAPVAVEVDPLLGPEGAGALVELCHRRGRYRLYVNYERTQHPLGAGLPPRHDSVDNFLATGGLHGSAEPVGALVARTSYLREEYAYGGRTLVDGIDGFLHSPRLHDAAARVHDADLVEPSIAYANLMLPGQELAVHTDVPEFRGLDRKQVPQWLLVAMLHSGRFDRWRLRIATGIAWFHGGDDGALRWWPDGPAEPPQRHRTRFDTALVLDTDLVFHGVERVGGIDVPPPPIRDEAELVHRDGRWVLEAPGGEELAVYRWEDLRFSVSWKAYCFRDEAEREAWRTGSDPIHAEEAVAQLTAALPDGGRGASGPELGRRIAEHHIRFPTPA